jgi:branched-chain amino acid transport system ATP-binding protein
LGLALTHQIVRPFREMTALDNVVLAAGYLTTSSPLQALSRSGRRAEIERASDILARVGLAGSEHKLAGTLPLGLLKRLEVARALALDPKIILLDEPLAGLNHAEAFKQIETILEVNASGVTAALVEHNLEEVLRVCRRLVVLNNGAIIADGSPTGVMADPVVREAYIGAGTDHHATA